MSYRRNTPKAFSSHSNEQARLNPGWPHIEGGTLKKYLWAPLLVLALAGCGGPAKDATYENASKLREAVISSGVECPGDASKHDDTYGEDFLKCSPKLALSVYDKDENQILSNAVHSMSKDTYLSGTRWTIQGDAETLGKLKDKLGGKLTVS